MFSDLNIFLKFLRDDKLTSKQKFYIQLSTVEYLSTKTPVPLFPGM